VPIPRPDWKPNLPDGFRAQLPLAQRCTLGVGGAAEWSVTARSWQALEQALEIAARHQWPLTVLGGGSNVVVADAGIAGLVLDVGHDALEHVAAPGGVQVRAGAGRKWDEFVETCVRQNWHGVECLSGIPGSVGATPIQNVGAYGQEVASTLSRVVACDRVSGAQRVFSAAECGFGYRTSRFKQQDSDRYLIWEVAFEFGTTELAPVRHPEILEQLGQRPHDAANVRQAVLRTRRAKSMVLADDDPNTRSCGSFFLNPALPLAELDRLRALGPSVPAYAEATGRFKVPAAWLIEQAGFHKGQRWGRAGLSARHALAVVTDPGAQASEVVEVAHRLRDGVAARFGVFLEPEPRFLGFERVDAQGLPALQ
jgi:UDP-N-acetylmuramate dehydrogenase